MKSRWGEWAYSTDLKSRHGVRLEKLAYSMAPAWNRRSQVGVGSLGWGSRPTPLAWNRHSQAGGGGSRPTPLAWNRHSPGWGVGLLQWLEIAAVRLEGVGLLHRLQTAPWSQAGGVGLLHWLDIATVRLGRAGVGLLHWLDIATVRRGGGSRPTPLAWNHAMESGWGE